MNKTIQKHNPDFKDDKCPICKEKACMQCRCMHPYGISSCRSCVNNHDWHWENGKQINGHSH